MADGLDNRVTLQSPQKWTYSQMLEFLCYRAGIGLRIESNAFARASHREGEYAAFSGRFEDVTIRDAMSWYLYFSSASATLTNATLIVKPSTDNPELPEELRLPPNTHRIPSCSMETVTVKAGSWDACQLLEFVSYRAGFHKMIIAPSILTNSVTVDIDFGPLPAMDAIDAVLGRIDGTYSIRGDWIYFTRKTID